MCCCHGYYLLFNIHLLTDLGLVERNHKKKKDKKTKLKDVTFETW